MCPDGTTTAEDGQSVCNVTLAPATDLHVRYAVVVSFSVNVTGSDPQDIILKSGVSAPVRETPFLSYIDFFALLDFPFY